MLRALLVLSVLSATAHADDEDFGQCKEESFAATRVTPLRTDIYERDAKARIAKKSTTTAGGSSLVQTYDYDDKGRLATIHVVGTGSIAYDYDGKGRVATMRELDQANKVTRLWTRSYDDKGRLAHEQAQEGRKVVIDKVYSYDEKGRLAKLAMDKGATTQTMTYDDKGRLARTDAKIGTDTVAFTYKYDEKNRRIEQANPNGRLVYSYDCKPR